MVRLVRPAYAAKGTETAVPRLLPVEQSTTPLNAAAEHDGGTTGTSATPPSPIPASVVPTHPPPLHVCPAPHATPHAPQFVPVVSATHAPLHALVPAGHALPHTPPTHVALPPVGTAHAVHADPHDVTAVSDTQLPAHRCVPVAQLHTPAAPHAPFAGTPHGPDVCGAAEHTALPVVHTTMPAVSHPPLPTDVHPPPRAMQVMPQRLVPVGHTVPQTPAEQL